MDHRGRHQAQGSDIHGGDRSRPWSQVDPYPAADGHTHLSALEAELGKAAAKRREICFKMAHRFIEKAERAGGVGPTSLHFPAGRPGEDTDIRVDIEINKGLAFI